MKKKEAQKNPVCEPCESNFQENLDNMVNNVENYSKKDHDAKRREVTAAFGGKEKTTRKTTAKKPSMAVKSGVEKKTTAKSATAKKPAAKKSATKKSTAKKDAEKDQLIEIDIIEIHKI